jgi:integral membrane protein
MRARISTGDQDLGACSNMMFKAVLKFSTPPQRLRAVAFIEGLSYLVLLFVAMPLKYFADQPLAVRIVGSVHGALFIWLAILTLRAMRTRGKSFAWGSRIGIAAVIPFGTFALDRDLRADVEAYERVRSSEDSCARSPASD